MTQCEGVGVVDSGVGFLQSRTEIVQDVEVETEG